MKLGVEEEMDIWGEKKQDLAVFHFPSARSFQEWDQVFSWPVHRAVSSCAF